MGDREIWFKACQEGEMWDYQALGVALGATIIEVWNWYDEGTVLEDMGVSSELIQNYYEAKCIHFSSQRKNFPNYEEGMDVYLLRVDEDFIRHVKEAFKAWIYEAIAWDSKTGADDGTYDYYPDVWFVGSQIAPRLGAGAVAAYRGARKVLLATTKYGEDEELGELIPVI